MLRKKGNSGRCKENIYSSDPQFSRFNQCGQNLALTFLDNDDSVIELVFKEWPIAFSIYFNNWVGSKNSV